MALHPPPGVSDENRFARRAIVSLWVVAGALGLAAVGCAAAGLVVALAPAGRQGYADAVGTAEAIEGATAALLLLAAMPSLVLWLMWFAAAVERLPSLGIQPRQTAAMSVVWWFIPIANLFMPKRTTNDLWRSGDLAAPARDPAWTGRPVADVVHWWWAAYIAFQLVSGATFAWIPDAEDPRGELLAYYAVSGVLWLLGLAVALLSIWITREIDARQHARAAQLHPAGPVNG